MFLSFSAVVSGGSKMQIKSAKGASLTRREREIVALVAEVMTNKEIAEDLCISQATVRTHLTSIFLKLGVRNRLRLIVYAYRNCQAAPLD
jgi:DNA-binding CsgD family transcriptional regulator